MPQLLLEGNLNKGLTGAGGGGWGERAWSFPPCFEKSGFDYGLLQG